VYPPAGAPEAAMIEALKSDAIVEKAGGRFKLCSLIQRRLVQLMEGARPLVERQGRSDLELVIEEIMQDKIALEYVAQPALPAAEPQPEPALQ
jgi:DNA-directed RNA polymerase subunit omega